MTLLSSPGLPARSTGTATTAPAHNAEPVLGSPAHSSLKRWGAPCELRNHTARVISAVESGEPVVLTVHGPPVADIVPRESRSERRPSERVLADLADIEGLASELDVHSPGEDFDTGLTTDDLAAQASRGDHEPRAALHRALLR